MNGRSLGSLLSSNRNGLRSIRRRDSSLIVAACGVRRQQRVRYALRQQRSPIKLTRSCASSMPCSRTSSHAIEITSNRPLVRRNRSTRRRTDVIAGSGRVADARNGISGRRNRAAAAVCKQTMFERGAHHRSGPLRTQRQAAAAAIGERVHLFLDDVGRFADPAYEEIGRFEDRRPYFAVAVARRQRVDVAFQRLPTQRLERIEVRRAARGTALIGHVTSSSRPTRSPSSFTSHCTPAS